MPSIQFGSTTFTPSIKAVRPSLTTSSGSVQARPDIGDEVSLRFAGQAHTNGAIEPSSAGSQGSGAIEELWESFLRAADEGCDEYDSFAILEKALNKASAKAFIRFHTDNFKTSDWQETEHADELVDVIHTRAQELGIDLEEEHNKLQKQRVIAKTYTRLGEPAERFDQLEHMSLNELQAEEARLAKQDTLLDRRAKLAELAARAGEPLDAIKALDGMGIDELKAEAIRLGRAADLRKIRENLASIYGRLGYTSDQVKQLGSMELTELIAESSRLQRLNDLRRQILAGYLAKSEPIPPDAFSYADETGLIRQRDMNELGLHASQIIQFTDGETLNRFERILNILDGSESPVEAAMKWRQRETQQASQAQPVQKGRHWWGGRR